VREFAGVWGISSERSEPETGDSALYELRYVVCSLEVIRTVRFDEGTEPTCRESASISPRQSELVTRVKRLMMQFKRKESPGSLTLDGGPLCVCIGFRLSEKTAGSGMPKLLRSECLYAREPL
jgi:hypothetical protein